MFFFINGQCKWVSVKPDAIKKVESGFLSKKPIIVLLAGSPLSIILFMLIGTGFFSSSFYTLSSIQFINAMPRETGGDLHWHVLFSGGVASALSLVMMGYLIERSSINAAFLLISAFYILALTLLLKEL